MVELMVLFPYVLWRKIMGLAAVLALVALGYWIAYSIARGDLSGRFRTLKRAALFVFVPLGVPMVVVIAVSLLGLSRGLANYDRTASVLMEDLGFKYSSPYVKGREVFVIWDVEPGKPMAQAGLREGDLVKSQSFLGFFENLERSRGGSMGFTIEREGKRIGIVVQVPPRRASPPHRRDN